MCVRAHTGPPAITNASSKDSCGWIPSTCPSCSAKDRGSERLSSQRSTRSRTALLTSAAMLQDGEHSVIGGMDCASSQPYLLPAARAGVRLGGAKLVDGAHADAWTGEDDVPLNVTSALCAQSLGVEPKDQEALVERRRARGQPEGAAKLRNGNPGMVIPGDVDYGDEAWASLDGRAVAVGVFKAGELHPTRVFVQPVSG